MKLEITGIHNAGDLERERIVFHAKGDVDVGNFAIFVGRAATDDGSFLSGNVAQAYWFQGKEIKAGDYVVLYTKKGTASSKPNKGHTSYFFYRGWNEAKLLDGYAVALVETSDWETATVPPEIP